MGILSASQINSFLSAAFNIDVCIRTDCFLSCIGLIILIVKDSLFFEEIVSFIPKNNKLLLNFVIFAFVEWSKKNKLIAFGAVFALILFFWILSEVRHYRWVHGVIENHPVRIYDVNYLKEFNDLNQAQLDIAQVVGVPPVANRDEAGRMKKKLVEIEDNDVYVIDNLTHSIPFLTPAAAELLQRIGRNFQDSLSSKGLNPNKMIVTSVLRTQDDVARLRKSGNINAAEKSTHCHATTFDIAYARFQAVPDLKGRPYEPVPPEQLKAVLGQVLRDLRKEGLCYVKYEKKQACFHITSRKLKSY